METLKGKLTYWTQNPAVGARKLAKLLELEPEPIDRLEPSCDSQGRLAEARRHLLPDIDIDEDEDDSLDTELARPLNFYVEFCLKTAFPETYDDCNFGQGLNALEYLQNMERARHQSLRKAAKALGLTAINFHHVVEKSTLIRCWVQAVDQLSPECDKYYSLCYMDLRVWYIFTQMKLNRGGIWKAETIAIINTLLPPDLKVEPNPRISKALMNHYRRQMYHLLLATLKDENLIDRMIKTINSPNIDGQPPFSTFRSWEETRNALLGYFQLSKRMIQDAENVEEEAKKLIGISSSTAAVIANKTPRTQNLESTLAIANFLGLGEELDVKQRHIKAVAEFSRRLDDQQKVNEELEKRLNRQEQDFERRFNHQEQDISSLRRSTNTFRRKENSYVAGRKACESANPSINSMNDVHEKCGRVHASTANVLHSSPTEFSSLVTPTRRQQLPKPEVQSLRGPLAAKEEILMELGESSTYLSLTKATNVSQSPEMESGLATFSRARVLADTAQLPILAGNSRVCSTARSKRDPNCGNLETGSVDERTPKSNIDVSKFLDEPKTKNTTTDTNNNRNWQANSPVRRKNACRNPLLETPEITTPPFVHDRRSKVSMATFLQSDPKFVDSISEASQTMNEPKEVLPGSTKLVENRERKMFFGFGGKKMDVANSDRLSQSSLGVEYPDSTNSSLASFKNETERNTVFSDQRFTPKKKGSLAYLRGAFVRGPDSDLSDLPAPSNPWTPNQTASSKDLLHTGSSKGNKKRTKRPKIRSTFTGRLLPPNQLAGDEKELYKASIQNFTFSPQNIDDRMPRLSADIVSRQSTDTRLPRPSVDTAVFERGESRSGRPGSSLSQTTRERNVLRKITSQNSMKAAVSNKSHLFSPKSPGTPKTDEKKFGWSSLRSRTSQERQRMFVATHQDGPPISDLPSGFQFPNALENETPEQTAALEEIRAQMIAEAYEMQGLNPDGTERAENDENDQQTPQSAKSGLGLYIDENSSIVTPTPAEKKKDESPLMVGKKVLKAFATSYSPDKPQMATWHLNIPNAICDGSEGSPRPQVESGGNEPAQSTIESDPGAAGAHRLFLSNTQSEADP